MCLRACDVKSTPGIFAAAVSQVVRQRRSSSGSPISSTRGRRRSDRPPDEPPACPRRPGRPRAYVGSSPTSGEPQRRSGAADAPPGWFGAGSRRQRPAGRSTRRSRDRSLPASRRRPGSSTRTWCSGQRLDPDRRLPVCCPVSRFCRMLSHYPDRGARPGPLSPPLAVGGGACWSVPG